MSLPFYIYCIGLALAILSASFVLMMIKFFIIFLIIKRGSDVIYDALDGFLRKVFRK